MIDDLTGPPTSAYRTGVSSEPGGERNGAGATCRQAAVPRACHTTWRLPAPEPHRVRLAQRDVLVRSGTRFEGLYVIRTGSCKQVISSPDGAEHVAAFCLPGEVLGLEALADGVHEATIQALEATTCWHLPPDRVDALLREDAAGARTLVSTLARELAGGARHKLLLGTMTADQRVASFLLELAGRYHTLGFSGSAFELRMTRAEIGSHLGVSTETVSRVLSRFRADGLVTVTRRSVHLRDRMALARVLLDRG